MAKSKRDFLHRSIANGYLAINRAIIHLGEVASEFELVHPELAEPLQLLCVMLEDGKTLIDQWVDRVWSRTNVDYESWSNRTASHVYLGERQDKP
jgi:hypothetical protein